MFVSWPVRSRLASLAKVVGFAFPEGSRLPNSVWRRRHHGILVLLWLQAIGIACFSLYTRHSVAHSLLDGGIIAAAALAAALPLRPRTVPASIAAFGLIASSAVLVHLSGGFIEFHFHFFVMVGLLALYQEWVPFLLAIGFVLVHHGVVGVLDPSAVYNHPAALTHPWRWAAIHAAFIAAMSVISLITWRVNETTHALAQLLLDSAGDGIVGLDLEGRVTFVNDAAVKLFAWGQRPVIGAPLHVLLPIAADEAGRGWAIGERGTSPRAGQETFGRPDGTTVPVEYVSTAMSERGAMVGTVVVFNDVTERQQAFQESERRRRAAEGLADVGRLMSQSLDLQEVSQRIVESVRELFGSRTSTLRLLEPDGSLRAIALGGQMHEYLPPGHVLPAGVSVGGLAVATGRAAWSPDVLTDPRVILSDDLRQRLQRSRSSAFLAVPLRVRGKIIGVLNAGDFTGRAFTEAEIFVLQAFADQAAIAVENARLHAETHARLVQSETLLAVAQEASATLDVTEMMRRVAREAARALGADMAGAFLATADHDSLRPLAGYHVPKHLLSDFMTFSIPLKGHALLEEAWKEQRAVASSDVAADRRVDPEFLKRFPHRSNLFCPMVVQGEPIAGLFVTWFEHEHRFTAAELRLVEGISRQAGIALANARLVEELKTRQARSNALMAVGHELSRIQPVEPLLGRIAETCGRLFDASSVTFRLVDGDDLVLCGAWGATKDVRASVRLKIGEGLTGAVATTGEPLIVEDPVNDPRLSPALQEGYRQLGIRAFLGVPVKSDDRVIGVLTVRTSRDEGVSAADVEMATAFAAQAAIALANSRLYQELQCAFQELSTTQDQLVQAQKMEAIGQLAGGVAHDFNNLLTVITGQSDLLLRSFRAEDPLRQKVELIRKTGQRAAELTRQLLAFSRKQVLQPKAVDLNGLVGGVAPMLRRLIGEHIELLIVPGSGLGRVMADPGQLEQVIMNLTLNARDAMPEGGTVRIETESRNLREAARHALGHVPPGAYMALRVQDTGSGMDAATLTRIFEPFFTTKDPGRGTGLGLSTVHGIVHQSGGFIGVDSTIGRGTIFTIYLPRTIESVEAAEPSPRAAVAGGKETVLLVEDDDDVRQLAVEVLNACGYAVLDTGDPREAVGIGQRHRGTIRLLVTDMVMPVMRGPALATKLLALDPQMRVLYMSGYTDAMIASQGTIEPPGRFLQKPFTPNALAASVREALDTLSPSHPHVALA